MSIHIDQNRCIGCGQCAQVCPGNLISLVEGKARIVYPRDCWGCTSCLKECAVGAVFFYLGADIGGRGSTLQLKRNGRFMDWIVIKPDGCKKHIIVDSTCSNAY